MIELHPELARAIVDGIPVGVAVISAERKVVWSNNMLSELLMLEPANIIGRDPYALELPLSDDEFTVGDRPGYRIEENGSLIGLSRQVQSTRFSGITLLVIERDHAIEWFFDALSNGSFDGSASSRLLTSSALRNRLELEVSRSRRYDNPLSCLLIRIDFGARDGSDVRQPLFDGLVTTLREQLRWVDVLGRWSDQALAVILPETSEIAARRLSEKIAAAIKPVVVQHAPGVAVNVGSTSWRRGDDGAAMIRRADIAARRQIGSTARTISF